MHGDQLCEPVPRRLPNSYLYCSLITTLSQECCRCDFRAEIATVGSAGTTSQSQIVIYGNGDLLLRSQVPLRRLNRRMPQQKLDLFQIAAVLAAELSTGAAQIMGTEAFDPDLLR